jgi:pimeloyl-ACP methyl ester carboxylesterase
MLVARSTKVTFLMLAALALSTSMPSSALGQAGAKAKIPPPEDVTLETSDGVGIRATWYAGVTNKGKESVPLIMLHGFDGSRGEYDGLAKALQLAGHSSIVPDLRGHGESKTQRGPAGPITLEAEKLRPRDMEAMTLDVEACKKFLMEKNNAGQCNIEMLCVVGAELGSIVAMRYAAADWSVPNLPAFKQGQDVHGLILLSPRKRA